MSFFKALCLAIFASIFLTYVLGISLLEWLNINIYMGDSLIEPLKAISISALVMVIITLVTVAIVISVFGGVIFITLLILGSIAMALIGVFGQYYWQLGQFGYLQKTSSPH